MKKIPLNKYIVLSVLMLTGMLLFGQIEARSEDAANDQDGQKLLAVGDGIELTLDEVNALKEFSEAGGMFTNMEEYRKTALEFELYAEEALKRGLGDEIPEDIEPNDHFARKHYLANKYLWEVVMEEYPLPDVAIESYYNANPSRYSEYSEEDNAYVMPPMSEADRLEIRKIIMAAKTKDVRAEEYEKLKRKYNVKLCDMETGCEKE